MPDASTATKMGGGEHARAEIVLYQFEGANVPVEVTFANETFWLSQKAMAELFGVTVATISEHLANIFDSGELDKASSTNYSGFSEINRAAGRPVTYYNLDAIIAVGYRVNSLRATRFRQWATKTLREYVVKGFVINDDMLKNGAPFGRDYFDELLARIRDIRASERRFWLKITDVFQECCYDYDAESNVARDFFATVQNKMHYAITGQTAAEIVYARSDASKPNMGLTSWKGSPDGRVHSSDVAVAKNYLAEGEIEDLNRLVSMFLDVVEDRAHRRQLTSMTECVQLVDDFLQFNGRGVLSGKGAMSQQQARQKDTEQFAMFQKIQDAYYENDFEKQAKRLGGGIS